MPRHLFIALALCVVSISAPALADRKHHKGHHGHHDGHHRDYRHDVVYREVYHVPARTVVHHYYSAPPRYYAPAPVYVREYPRHDNAGMWIGTAMLAGAVLHHVDHHR